MAKPFYSIEEVCQKLGKNQDQVKELVRTGALREFRDAGKVFFKADEVDKLSGAAKSDTGDITLEPVEELPSVGSGSGGTSIIGLEPLADEAPPPPRPAAAPPPAAAGKNVLDEDEVDIEADPMAKTQITAGVQGDQLTLESGGSGSGLLDLTREADDTSLGAELLDEIYPGEDEMAAPARPAAPPPRATAPAAPPQPAEDEELPTDVGEIVLPTIVSTADPAEGALAGLMVGALLVLALAGSVVAGALQGFLPDYASFLSNNLLYLFGTALLLPLIGALVGWLAGRGR